MPAGRYLRLLTSHAGELLDQSPPDAHPHSLTAAIRLAIDRLVDIDPAELGRNYPIEVGVEADALVALSAIESELDLMGHEPMPWREEEVSAVLATVRSAIGDHIEIDVLDQLRTALPPESLVFNDPTSIAFWARSLWGTDRPRTWFVPSSPMSRMPA